MSNPNGNEYEEYRTYKLQINWIRRRVRDVRCFLKHRQSAHEIEDPQDRASRRTANATYWIAFLSFVTIGVSVKTYLAIDGQLEIMRGQLKEMQDSGKDTQKIITANVKLADAASNSADIAAKNLIATQRAWLGPVDASMTKTPNDALIKGVVSYVNSGKEPAKFSATYSGRVYHRTSWEDGTAYAQIVDDQNKCLDPNNGVAGQRYAWPTSGFTNYSIHFPELHIPQIGAYSWTDDLEKGQDIFLVDGCFAYYAFAQLHHTAFCYFYDAHISDIAHLNICSGGNDVN